MKDLIKVTNLTMSSLEVAKLTGKQHKHVIRDIENLLKELSPDLGSLMKSTTYKDSNGINRKLYNLPKRETLILTSGYSAKQRAGIIDRWLALEEANQPKLPGTYLEALEKLVESEKDRQKALEEVNKLNTIIDNEFGYTSILRAAAYAGVHESCFNWRPLKRTTLGLGLEVKRVPSPRYKYQNLYPIRAFEMVYPDIDFDDLKPEQIDDKALLALGVASKLKIN